MTEDRPAVAVVLRSGGEGGGYDDAPPGLEARVGDTARLRPAASLAELTEALADAEAAFVWDFQSEIFGPALPSARRLRWVHVASVGLDAVLGPDMAENDVVITNSKGVFDRGIAEWVLGMLLVFYKGFLITLDNQRRKVWQHHDSQLLEGRHVLVVGAGSIGRSIARVCRCAGMSVGGIARRGRDDDPDFGVVAPVSEIDQHLGGADAVVVCLPLTPSTSGLFDADRFAACKPGALFLNVGRGPVVREDALTQALERGQLGGAALDVFETEPLPSSSPLWEMENVIVSPHCSGDVVGWRERLVDLFVENLERFRKGDDLMNVVDKKS